MKHDGDMHSRTQLTRSTPPRPSGVRYEHDGLCSHAASNSLKIFSCVKTAEARLLLRFYWFFFQRLTHRLGRFHVRIFFEDEERRIALQSCDDADQEPDRPDDHRAGSWFRFRFRFLSTLLWRERRDADWRPSANAAAAARRRRSIPDGSVSTEVAANKRGDFRRTCINAYKYTVSNSNEIQRKQLISMSLSQSTRSLMKKIPQVVCWRHLAVEL